MSEAAATNPFRPIADAPIGRTIIVRRGATLARVLGPMAARAFMAKFAKPITVHARPAEDGTGRAQFGFQLAKPGLLPTALERDWFSGFVAGYQAAVNLGMSLTMPEETRQ